jgi:hypothetical protein
MPWIFFASDIRGDYKESVMSIQTMVLAVALGLAASALPKLGYTTYVEVDAAPPPPRAEATPEAKSGHIWVPGYWGWSGSQHVWVNGQYVPERLHHHWVAARWEHRGTHWYFQDGTWESDDETKSE